MVEKVQKELEKIEEFDIENSFYLGKRKLSQVKVEAVASGLTNRYRWAVRASFEGIVVPGYASSMKVRHSGEFSCKIGKAETIDRSWCPIVTDN